MAIDKKYNIFKHNLKFIFIFFLLINISCKKNTTYHKLKFEIIFNEVPDPGFSNWYTVTGEPHYPDEELGISTEIAVNNRYWKYEYWELKDNDEVLFSASGAFGNLYEMRVFIEEEQVSYKKIYGYTVIEESGIHDTSCFGCDGPTIKFTFNE